MSCVKEPSASWVSSLLPFLWRVECQAGNPGMAQELSEPGTLARNVVQHNFFFLTQRHSIHSEMCMYKNGESRLWELGG